MLLLIAAAMFGGMLGGGAYVLLSRYYPLYSARVLFEVQPGVSDANDVGSRQTLKDEEVYRLANTQTEYLTSRGVIEEAVGNPDLQNKTRWFQRNFIGPGGTPMVDEATDELMDSLKTSVLRGTELFQISWSTHQPRDVPIVLLAVQQSYMSLREQLDNKVYNQTLEVFRNQLAKTNIEIEDIDQEIARFIRERGMTSLDDTRYHQASLAIRELTEQITAVQQDLNVSQTNYLQTAAKLEGKLKPTSEDELAAEGHYSVTSQIQTVQDIKVELRIVREKYPFDHPIVQELERRQRAAEAEIEAKVDELIRQSLSARLKFFGSEIERLQKVLEELEDEAEANDMKLRELTAHHSEYEAMQTRREQLERQRDGEQQIIKEIQLMRLRDDSARIRVAEPALTPRAPTFPRKEIVIPLGVLVMLGLTTGIIFLRELTDQRVKSARDIAILPGAHVLGVIPDIEDDPTKCESAERVLKHFPNSIVAESYRQAQTPLAKMIDRNGYQTMMLTGGLPGAGTTTAAVNLAAGFAAAGRNVVVVDANFRRPRLAEVMEIERDAPGLGDLLAGDATLADVAHEIDTGLSGIAAGTPASRVIERLGGDRFDSLLAELRARYDLIIFDTPPAVVAGDSMVVANKVDAAMLIVRASQEQRGLVARLINQFDAAHCELLGLMLNRPRGTAGGYFKKNFATMASYTAKSAS
jgi:capsular exopolysaccharide synthesis family protein